MAKIVTDNLTDIWTPLSRPSSTEERMIDHI